MRGVDAAARVRFEELVRAGADLDGLHAHVDEQLDRIAVEMEELRHRLQLVEQRTGLATRKPRGAHTRKLAVIELRQQGHSLRSIALLLGVARHTVEADLRGAGDVAAGQRRGRRQDDRPAGIERPNTGVASMA